MNVAPDFQITARVAGDNVITFASNRDIVLLECRALAVDAEPLLAARPRAERINISVRAAIRA
jgi:hypothetical protein